MEFTLKETLQDALIAHKFLMHMYCQFEIECSDTKLRNLFEQLHGTVSEHHLKIFKLMNDKGFYPACPAPAKDIKQAVKMHTQMQEDLKEKLNAKN